MIGKRILHYKIIEQIGQGGMGVVFTPWDKASRLCRFYDSNVSNIILENPSNLLSHGVKIRGYEPTKRVGDDR